MQILLSALVSFIGCLGLSGCDSSVNSRKQVNRPQAVTSIPASSLVPNNQEVASPQVSSSGAKVFDAVLPLLRAKTEVPIRLPQYLATENETQPLYAIVVSASSSKYEIELGFTSDCSGGNVCHYGEVSGRRIRVGEDHATGKSLRLANGITGYFVDASCGATCSDSTLTWDDNGYRYTVGLKAEKLETLKRVVDSVILR